MICLNEEAYALMKWKKKKNRETLYQAAKYEKKLKEIASAKWK